MVTIGRVNRTKARRARPYTAGETGSRRAEGNQCSSAKMSAQSSPSKMKELRLPISRVRTIMKSSPYVDAIGQDGLYLVTKATELFIHFLTEEAHSQSNKGPNLDYKHLAEVVQTNHTLEFLREIMSRKITVRQFKEMMAEKNANSSSSDSSSESGTDSESDTESDTDSDKKENNGHSSDGESNAKENGKANSASEKSGKSDSEDESKR